MTTLLCKLFGHKMPTGYGGGLPYLDKRQSVLDGMGTEHWYLYGDCSRCGETYDIAKVHGPLKFASPKEGRVLYG